MPATYFTKQGQTVDLACADHYGRTAEVTEIVLAANPGLSALGPVLPIGTRITMPDVAKKTAAAKLLTLWE